MMQMLIKDSMQVGTGLNCKYLQCPLWVEHNWPLVMGATLSILIIRRVFHGMLRPLKLPDMKNYGANNMP